MKTTIGRLCVLLLALVCVVPIAGCVLDEATTAEATDAAVGAQSAIAELQAKNQANAQTAQAALTTANLLRDQVAAEAAQIRIDAAAREAKILAKAKEIADGAVVTAKAAGGEMSGVMPFVATLGGTVPPPWGTVIELGGGVALAVWKSMKAAQAKRDAAAALAAAASVASHGNTPGVSSTDVATHEAVILSGMSAGAAAMYNAMPDFRTASDGVLAKAA